MNPEEVAEIKIFNWLRPKVKEIYFNRKNILSCPIFKLKGSLERPDLLIKTFDNEYIVLEIKPSNEAKKIQKAREQLYEQYYLPYCNLKTKYFIEGEEVEIKHFLIATEKSKEGRLFPRNDFLLDNLEDKDEHRKRCVLVYGTMPRYEYSRTRDFLRSLWSRLKQDREKNKELFVKKCGLGILMADYKDKEPYVFVMYFNKQKYWKMKK